MNTRRVPMAAWGGRVLGSACGVAIAFAANMAASQDMPSPEEMWRIIQAQQAEIDALKQRIGEREAQAEETAQAIEAVVDSMESQSTGTGWWDRTQMGGYGELHYNSPEGKAGTLDFHRFVLFFGHDFDTATRMFSELELEHALAGDGKPGEVELEQAYIEHDFSDTLTGRTGVMLLPVGIRNEVHEPPTFYGVERNNVEKNIIPTTWWEGGVGGTVTTAVGLQIDAMVHGGPRCRRTVFSVRSGRQKAANSVLEDPAVTTRIRYTGIPGVELAGTLQYQSDLTQGDEASASLIAVHADLARPISDSMNLGLRALYAGWDIESVDAEAMGRDSQTGWYVEPSVRMLLRGSRSVGLFARYEAWDTKAGNSADTEESQWVVGINYWLHPNAVLKADYVSYDKPGSDTVRTLNLGVGYQF